MNFPLIYLIYFGDDLMQYWIWQLLFSRGIINIQEVCVKFHYSEPNSWRVPDTVVSFLLRLSSTPAMISNIDFNILH